MADPSMQAIALVTNGISTAFVLLVNCLKNTGAIDDGRFENALKSTIDAPGAAVERLDYQVLGSILRRLEGEPPPELRLILGGKSEED